MIFDKKRRPKYQIIEDPQPKKTIGGLTWALVAILLIALSMFISTMASADSDNTSNSDSAMENTEVDTTGMLYFESENGKRSPSLHLQSHADVSISGLVASVQMSQTFNNDTTDWVEGIYVFPLPENAAVSYMEMQIGERKIIGKIKEKKEAKKIYQAAKKAGKHAALTSQQRPNVFTQKVANIAPNETVKIILHYQHQVRYQSSEFEWRLPTTITPRYIPGVPLAKKYLDDSKVEPSINDINSIGHAININGWGMATTEVPDGHLITPFMQAPKPGQLTNPISINITLNSGLNLSHINSPYHEITIQKQNGIHSITLTNLEESMDRDFVLNWRPVASHAPQSALFTETINHEHYALLMVLPPSTPSTEALPRDMVFVIDTSGSMQGNSIEQAKLGLIMALQKLRPNDNFNIIEFNTYHSSLFSNLQPATNHNTSTAINWVNHLKADGGTEMLPALKTSLKQFTHGEKLQQLIFITDGAIGNESALFSTIHNNIQQIRLFTVGIGSAPNSYFMRKAAQFGRGTFTHIGNNREVTKKMTVLFQQIENAIASNITINWPTNAEHYPERIPDLYAGEPLLVAAKVDQLTGELFVSGTTASQSWTQSLSLAQHTKSKKIGNVWAREKIESLEDKKIAGGDAKTIREEVLEIALTHSLLSPYTSFVAVEEKIVRPINSTLKQNSIANLVANGQKLQRQTATVNYPNTATGAQLSIWLGALSFVVFILFRRMRDAE